MARLRTVMVWIGMMALFVAMYAGLPVGRAVVGVVVGAILWWASLALSRRVTRSQSRAVSAGAAVLGAAAAALCGVPCGGTMIVAGAAIPLAITGCVLGAGYLEQRRHRRLLANLESGGDLAPMVAELESWKSADVTFAMRALLLRGRPDLVLQLVGMSWWRHRHAMLVMIMRGYQVSALLDLGRVEEARAAIDECPDPGDPILAENLALTRVRVAVAEGTVTEVPPLVHEGLRDFRLEVVADVLALGGDREGARLALVELRGRDRERIVRLGRSTRPAAAIATELLADAGGAYR